MSLQGLTNYKYVYYVEVYTDKTPLLKKQFDSITEASEYYKSLSSRYKKFNIKYYTKKKIVA
jgi:hypothetical protein